MQTSDQSTAPTMTDFRKELESLINKNCRENSSDTPDFILAQYLTDSLESFDRAIIARETWYGRKKAMSPNDPKLSHAGWKPGVASTKNDEKNNP